MRLLSTAAFIFASVSTIAQTKDGVFRLDKEYAISQTGMLKLNASDAKVTITGSTRTTAHVKIYHHVSTKGIVFGHEEFNVDVYEENGDVVIRERSNSSVVGMVGYTYEQYTIDIEVPGGVALQARGDDGDYLIKNLGGSISLDIDDADVELLGCTGDDFRFQVDDGEIVMDQGKGKLDIDADDADIKIDHADFTSIIADVDDGDFIVETSLTNGGEYQINAQDGMIALTITKGGGQFEIRHGDARVITVGDFKQVEKSENRTSLALANGSARIDIHADDARVRLTKK